MQVLLSQRDWSIRHGALCNHESGALRSRGHVEQATALQVCTALQTCTSLQAEMVAGAPTCHASCCSSFLAPRPAGLSFVTSLPKLYSNAQARGAAPRHRPRGLPGRRPRQAAAQLRSANRAPWHRLSTGASPATGDAKAHLEREFPSCQASSTCLCRSACSLRCHMPVVLHL